MNPLSLLFLMPRALVKIKRSFLLKLTVWLWEHALMRVHCKPGASGQKGILWPLGFLWVQLGGPGPLVAWEEIEFLSSKGFQLHPSAKRRKNIARLLFLGVKETERPDILGASALFLNVLRKKSYMLWVLTSLLGTFSARPPVPTTQGLWCVKLETSILMDGITEETIVVSWVDVEYWMILVTAEINLIMHCCQQGCVQSAGQLRRAQQWSGTLWRVQDSSGWMGIGWNPLRGAGAIFTEA